MDTQQQHSTEVVGCPRCDYDLSGEVRTWDVVCPLNGVCPECGLVIRWGSLLAKDARRPESFFETSRAKPRKAFIETFRRAKNPFRFWHWVKMEYGFNWERTLLLTLGGMLAMHAVLTLSIVIVCSVIHQAALLNAAVPAGHLPAIETAEYAAKAVGNPFIHQSRAWLYTHFNHGESSLWILVALVSAIAMPGAFLLLPATLSRAKVKARHLSRVMFYSLVWLPFVWFMLTAPSVLNTTIDLHSYITTNRNVPGGVNVAQSVWQTAYKYLLTINSVIVDYIFMRYEFVITICAAFGWNVVWWWNAGARYLKIPRPFFVSLLLTILTTLFLIVLTLPIFGVAAIRQLLPQ